MDFSYADQPAPKLFSTYFHPFEWLGITLRRWSGRILDSLQWLDNNSAHLITQFPWQKKKKEWSNFTHEESETKAFQILEWISISKLMVETFWTVASAGALITVQWLYSESLT